jgi:hypothetical protein
MFLDGYRNILEQLLGGIGQNGGQQNGARSPTHEYPPYPGQQPNYGAPNGIPNGVYNPFPVPPQNYGTPNGARSPYGPGHILGGTPQPQYQPQPRPTRRVHYSVTTIGPDGRVHHITNESRPDSPLPGGRQVAVPTLENFLEMHNQHLRPEPGTDYEDPFGGGQLGMMLRHIMESVTPIHGSRGDYLPYVFPD